MIGTRSPNLLQFQTQFSCSKPQFCKGSICPSRRRPTFFFSLSISFCCKSLHALFLRRNKIMALRGVWQLRKLVVSYCNWGGSSRGIRAFMESELPAFKEKNPHLEVVTELNRGQHPFLKGLYKNKNERVVCVKNLSQDEILEAATKLRNSLGRKVVKLKSRHVTKQPSVQGTWSTALEL